MSHIIWFSSRTFPRTWHGSHLHAEKRTSMRPHTSAATWVLAAPSANMTLHGGGCFRIPIKKRIAPGWLRRWYTLQTQTHTTTPGLRSRLWLRKCPTQSCCLFLHFIVTLLCCATHKTHKTTRTPFALPSISPFIKMQTILESKYTHKAISQVINLPLSFRSAYTAGCRNCFNVCAFRKSTGAVIVRLLSPF